MPYSRKLLDQSIELIDLKKLLDKMLEQYQLKIVEYQRQLTIERFQRKIESERQIFIIIIVSLSLLIVLIITFFITKRFFFYREKSRKIKDQYNHFTTIYNDFITEYSVMVAKQLKLNVELGLRKIGTTLVYTTHQLGEVERLCDQIVVMDRGRSIAAGTLAELQESANDSTAGATLHLGADVDLDEVSRVLNERGVVHSVERAKKDIEAIFLELTGRALRDEES